MFLFTVCALQETILPLCDEREGDSAGDLLDLKEQQNNRSCIVTAQHTKPCCVSLDFFSKGIVQTSATQIRAYFVNPG